jgi:acetyl esterase/lipase
MPDSTDFVPGSHYAFQNPIPPANAGAARLAGRDLAYAGLSKAQRLDLYLPEGAGPHPLIISVHGGAFMGGDKADQQLQPMLAGLARGYAVASINYRMSGEAIFPALIQDAKAAVRWLRAHAAAYDLDPDRFAAWGGSAGGWQVLMMGVTGGAPVFAWGGMPHTEQSDRLQAVVAWFPPTNFIKMDAHLAESGLAPAPEEAHSGANSPESLLIGAKIDTVPELVRDTDPATYLHPAVPPMLLQHGTGDFIVPYQQSVEFGAAAERLAPGRVRVELLAGAGHGDERFGAPDNVARVLDFLDQNLARF